MLRMAFAVIVSLMISLAAWSAELSPAFADNDPGDRSNTGDVRTSGIPGDDQYSIMQVGPSATDWIGLSRSRAYWVADRDNHRADVQAQSTAPAAAPAYDNKWGWLGLLGLVGLWGLFNKSRMP